MTSAQLKPGWNMVKFGDIAENVAMRGDPAEAKTDIYVGLEYLDPSTIHLRKWGHPSDVDRECCVLYKKAMDELVGRRPAPCTPRAASPTSTTASDCIRIWAMSVLMYLKSSYWKRKMRLNWGYPEKLDHVNLRIILKKAATQQERKNAHLWSLFCVYIKSSDGWGNHMDLIDRIKDLAARIPKQMDHIQTEEATKNAFIMPFLSALGYDVFNPMEVIPEYTADIGTKKGEKVDYAVKKDDEIIILIECKWSGVDLHQNHASQLYRYFSTTAARFCILTNGIVYEFYSDIDEPNKMDSKPFFEFNILDFEDHQINELKKFTKSAFSLEDILTTASTLKYTGAIKKILEKELENPSEEFVRFFASRIYDGRLTQSVLEQFREIVKKAREQFINEKINDRLKSALSTNEDRKEETSELVELHDSLPKNDDIETIEEEIEGYNIIKAILRNVVDVKRVVMRDTKSYCGILLDDNNRKPICRLHFNRTRKYLGLISDKQEERVKIESLDDIFKYTDKLRAVIGEYDEI